MIANDSKSTPTLIPYGTGSGSVSGTTLGATSTADEPSGAHSHTQSIWFELTGVPAGAFFVAIKAQDPVMYVEVAAYDGPSASLAVSADAIVYPSYRGAFYAGSPASQANSAAGGTVSFNVVSYEPDGSGVDFIFGWGSYADTDDSHWGPPVAHDWVTWDTRTRPSGFAAPYPDSYYNQPQSGTIGVARGQYSVNYGTVTPTPLIGTEISPNASQEACAWDNARYGNINDLGSLDCPGAAGLAAGTHNAGTFGRVAETGYHASHDSGSFFMSGYRSRYETSMGTGTTNLIAALNADRTYPRAEVAAASSCWGVAFDDLTTDGSVGTNQLRNLVIAIGMTDPNAGDYNGDNLRPDTQTWDVKMLALKASDQRAQASAPTADKWTNALGADWQNPFRSDQTVLATLGVGGSTQEVAIANPKPMLQSDADLGVTVAPRHLCLLRYYYRSSILTGSPAAAAIGPRGAGSIGQDYAERVFTYPYVVVDYKTQGHRLYYGFRLLPQPDLREFAAPPLVRFIPNL